MKIAKKKSLPVTMLFRRGPVTAVGPALRPQPQCAVMLPPSCCDPAACLLRYILLRCIPAAKANPYAALARC